MSTSIPMKKQLVIRKLIPLISTDTADRATSPTITSGTAVPTAAEPNGSIYLKTDGGLYKRQGSAWELVADITDVSEAAIDDAGTYYTTDTIDGAFDALGVQVGGDTDATYNFAEANVCADNDAVYAALNKLDLKFGDLASVANGEGASLVAVEDAGTYWTGTDAEAVLDEISTQIGGATSTTFNFTEANVLADNDAIYAALEKLDLKHGDYASVANGEGASLIGVEDVGGYYTGATVEAVLTELAEDNAWEHNADAVAGADEVCDLYLRSSSVAEQQSLVIEDESANNRAALYRVNGATPMSTTIHIGLPGDTNVSNDASVVLNSVTDAGVANPATILAQGQEDNLDFSGTATYTFNGNIAVTGTVDGRDIASDASKLTSTYGRLVKVTVVAAGAAASNNGTLDVDVFDVDGVAVTAVKEIMIIATTAQYTGTWDLVSTVTFNTPNPGAIVASGAGWCLARTDATGNFACVLVDTADETVYVSAVSPTAGIASIGEGCVVVESNSDDATWTA